MTPQDIPTLIVKYLAGEANVQEEHELRHWVDMDAENEQQFEKAYEAWDEIEQSPLVYRPDVEAAWEVVREKLGEENAQASPAFKFSFRKKWKWIVGLIILLGLVVGLINGMFTNASELTFESTEIEKIVWLPDSTKAQLNPLSQLVWNKDQPLKLVGGAHFFISKMANKELELSVGPLKVLSKDAHFHIQESPSNQVVEVVVESGSLILISEREKIVFQAGEIGTYQPQNKLVQKACK